MRPCLLLPLLAAPWLPAQTTLGWSLRQPHTGIGPAFAIAPTTGNPVRFGGFDSSIGAVPDLWEWAGGRWQRHTSREQPPASGSTLSGGVVMATDTLRGTLVLLTATSNRTWLWDGRAWSSQANSPLLQPRSDTAMAFDSQRGRMVMFGGNGTAVLGDTWEWDGSSWTPRAVGIAPGARFAHGCAYDAARGCTVLFGGRANLSNALGETWEWDGTTWRQRFPQHAPSARGNMAMAYDPLRQRTVLHGGAALLSGTLADTWEWDGNDWRQVTTPNDPPAAAGVAFVPSAASQRLVLFLTGITAVAQGSGEVVLEYDGSTWTTPQPTLPAARQNGALATDPVSGVVVLFGGAGGGTGSVPLGDTWTWNGEIWHQAAPAASPTPRFTSAMAGDVARGNLLLFGGAVRNGSSVTAFDDTWSWNGSTWTNLAPAVHPSARCGHALAYHRPSQRVVLFGGNDGTTQQTGTWSWDGVAWSLAAPTTSPPLRSTGRMVGTAQDLVLFGGSTWTSSPYQAVDLDDTWTWNGTDWAQVVTAHRPPARRYHTMAYEEDLQQVFVFSGLPGTSQALPGDLWRFDGVDWTQETSDEMPLERYGAHLAFDPRHRELVLFGGMRFRDQNDTLTLGRAGSQAGFGAGCAGSLGIPTLTIAATSLPEPGGSVALDLGGLPQDLAVVVMGFSATSAGGHALPLPLGGYGMPGCDLLVAPDAALVQVGALGTARWRLPLPSTAAMLGVTFWNQAFAFDPPANATGLTTTAAVRTTIGH